MARGLALDLGTTRIKAALFDGDGRLGTISSVPAPPLTGSGLVRESDPLLYQERACDLLRGLARGLPADAPVGLSSQRSSFLLWNRETGRPVTPLISWQDRRADRWCRRNRKRSLGLVGRTGLPLSPHYAGPKLAHLFAADRALHRDAERGKILFGTLDTWVTWKSTGRREHRTDLSMAARTLLADPLKGAWDDSLRSLFRVPSGILPAIESSWGFRTKLEGGGVLTASLADQPAALLALAGMSPESILVNLGTGGFVLFATGTRLRQVPGYLSGPAGSGPRGEKSFLLEGTVNGLSESLGDMAEVRQELMEEDPAPGVFCIPDATGVGSPYWIADREQSFSVPLHRLSPRERKAAVLEGIIFRLRQIIDDLSGKKEPPRVFISGGLASVDFLSLGLAACLRYPVYRFREKEASLLGAACLASGGEAGDVSVTVLPDPYPSGSYLEEKYRAWKSWADTLLSGSR
jgi:glycerol kinase